MPFGLSNTGDPAASGGQRASDRLTALRARPESTTDAPPSAGAIVAIDGSAEPDRDGGDSPVAPRRLGSSPGAVRERLGPLVRRWTPAPLQQARWDPGRPGAMMLSVVTALAAVLAAIGVWWDRPVPEPVPALPVLPTASPAAASPAPGAATELVVSVVGHVERPGLVRVPDGARVADALEAAGGAIPGTDLTTLNLARRLSDGEQLLVGVVKPGGPTPAGGRGSNGNGSAGPGLLNLNTATREQLEALPGVGPVTAGRILEWRAEHGRFTDVGQLREIDGIGPARFAELEGRVRV